MSEKMQKKYLKKLKPFIALKLLAENQINRIEQEMVKDVGIKYEAKPVKKRGKNATKN